MKATPNVALSARLLAGALLAGALASALPAGAEPVQALTTDSFAAIRARHLGAPVVVHIWGMTCAPCLSELPKWGRLLKQRRDLRLVLIEADPAPRDASTKVLTAAGLAGAENWAVSSEPDDYLRASIDPTWFGDMPRTLLISADGQVQRLRGVADLVAVNHWLDAASATGGKRHTPSSY